MKWKTFFVKIWWKKEIVMVYLSQIMPSCVNLNLSSPKMWAKFTHIHFSSPKIWAKNEPRSWVNWKKDHSRSHLPSSEHEIQHIKAWHGKIHMELFLMDPQGIFLTFTSLLLHNVIYINILFLSKVPKFSNLIFVYSWNCQL